MAKVHFSNFEVSMDPTCANSAGFITYNPGHLPECIRQLRDSGSCAGGFSKGTIWVASETIRINDWREKQMFSK